MSVYFEKCVSCGHSTIIKKLPV